MLSVKKSNFHLTWYAAYVVLCTCAAAISGDMGTLSSCHVQYPCNFIKAVPSMIANKYSYIYRNKR